jgi:hypothetical protein
MIDEPAEVVGRVGRGLADHACRIGELTGLFERARL